MVHRLILVGLLVTAACDLRAQTIPAGAVYQAAAANGIEYISPTAGTAIINQKSALNWKSVGVGILTDGSIGVLSAGLGGLITIPAKALAGLAVGHAFVDDVVQPILTTAAPSGLSNIAPVLLITGTVAVTPAACVENSMFATRFVSTAAPVKKGPMSAPVMAIIDGATFTFTPQGVQVLKNATGNAVRQFMVVDVLACPGGILTATPSPTTGTGKVDPANFTVDLNRAIHAKLETEGTFEDYDEVRLGKIMAAHAREREIAATFDAIEEARRTQ